MCSHRDKMACKRHYTTEENFRLFSSCGVYVKQDGRHFLMCCAVCIERDGCDKSCEWARLH